MEITEYLGIKIQEKYSNSRYVVQSYFFFANTCCIFICAQSIMESLVHRHTLVILINATTLMHKSTLGMNNFGHNHFGQKYQE